MGRADPNPQRPSGQSRPQLPAANRMSAPAASRLATITLNGWAGLSGELPGWPTGKSQVGENIPQLLLTTRARRLAGMAWAVWSSLEYDSTASDSSPDMAVSPGVSDSSRAWSTRVALGAAMPTSKAHMVPWPTGCWPGLVATPAGAQLRWRESLGSRPLDSRWARLMPVSTIATGTR